MWEAGGAEGEIKKKVKRNKNKNTKENKEKKGKKNEGQKKGVGGK